MTAEVLCVAGLPGCGKTTYLNQLARDGWIVFDDFKSGALDNSPMFHKSRHFEALIARLQYGQKCVLSDIDFCRTEARAEAERVLAVAAPNSQVRWLFFENDPVACEENIRHRGRDSLPADIECLRRYTSIYVIPTDTGVQPVATALPS